VLESRAEAIVRRRLVVRGAVRGVGFRVSCAERARQRGLAGWVRNCDDGSVEVVLEGEADAVASLVE
jgi:acylphosphatase